MTHKKLAFAEALATGKTATEAAIQAGYSPLSASSIGCRLAKDRDVLEHLARLRQTAPRYRKTDNPLNVLIQVMADELACLKVRVHAAESLLPISIQRYVLAAKSRKRLMLQ